MNSKQNHSKFFGLFGHDTQKEPEEGEIIEEDPSRFLQLPDHHLLSTRFVEEQMIRDELKKRKHCFICNLNNYKYTCPNCGTKTCSLKCSNQHKTSLKCSGIRNHLSFIPLKHYSEANFNSDYNFLEKGSEFLQNSNMILRNNTKKELSNWTTRFILETQKRRIQYKKMPLVFKKARSNKSIFLYKEKAIYWDIDFIFPYCDTKNEEENSTNKKTNIFRSIQFKRNRISENQLLGSIIQEIVNSSEWIKDLEDEDRNKIKQIEFNSYRDNVNDLLVMFKHESGRFYIPMNQKCSLKENLENKTIVEYPIVIVIWKSFSDLYKLYDEHSNSDNKVM